jgi:hypothetical protein
MFAGMVGLGTITAVNPAPKGSLANACIARSECPFSLSRSQFVGLPETDPSALLLGSLHLGYWFLTILDQHLLDCHL